MSYQVTDEHGLVRENEHLVMFIPKSRKAMIYRVLARANHGAEVLNYGAMPFVAAATLNVYGGGAVAIPANGVMPAMSYTATGMSWTPPTDITGLFDASDMWYIPEDDRTIIFHTMLDLTPAWLRIGLELPKGVTQQKLQRERAVLGVGKSAGFARGSFETVHIPELRYGYEFGNDTNQAVYTQATFKYGEYTIGIPSDPDLVWAILNKDIQAHWVTLPVSTYDSSIKQALIKDYGIEGYTLYPKEKKEIAKTEYRNIGRQIKPEVAV